MYNALVLLMNDDPSIQISQSSSYSLCSLIPSARRIKKLCPIQLMKAIKNEVEIAGMRNAHVRMPFYNHEFTIILHGYLVLFS